MHSILSYSLFRNKNWKNIRTIVFIGDTRENIHLGLVYMQECSFSWNVENYVRHFQSSCHEVKKKKQFKMDFFIIISL